MQNIITAIFKNESEGYQMITDLRKAPVNDQAAIMQMALVKCDNGGLTLLDNFDGIATTSEGTLIGGLTGGLIGILGGPLGILFMGTAGALAGSMVDASGSIAGEALLETVAGKLYDGEVGLIILAEEESEEYLDEALGKFDVEILRYDAVDVADEVEEAAEIQKEMDRQARKQLRQTKSEERKARRQEKLEAKKAELEADFEEYKKNLDV